MRVPARRNNAGHKRWRVAGGAHGQMIFPQLNSGSHADTVSDFFEVMRDMGGGEEGLDQFNDGFFHSGSR